VISWRPSQWDIRKLLLAGKREQLIRILDQMLESGLVRIRNIQGQGGNVTQWIIILDLTNYNLRQHACVNCEFLGNYMILKLQLFFSRLELTIQIFEQASHSTLNGSHIWKNITQQLASPFSTLTVSPCMYFF